MEPCVLFLFNSSVYGPAPWIQAGVHCVSVDYDDTDHSGARHAASSTPAHTRLNIDLSQPLARWRVQTALFKQGLEPRLVISFAPCTDLAVSGAAHFARKRARDPLFQTKAVRMAQLASYWGLPYMVENPISVLSTQWRKPDLVCHPWEFSGYLPADDVHPEAPQLYPPRDRYNKKTCLWVGHGFQLPPRIGEPLTDEEETQNPGFLKTGGKSAKIKHLRSLTPRGMSIAICAANLHLFCDILPLTVGMDPLYYAD